MSKVSVIIPNYNHAPYLKQRIDSILNQTFQDFEIIILDDYSTDNSKDIIEKYRNNPKISSIEYNEINSGSPFKQWKKGIERSKGEYIWIAESDDYCSLDFLEKINVFISKSKYDLGLVYTQSTDVDENNISIVNRIEFTDCFSPNIWKSEFEINGKEFIKKYLKVKCVIPNASAVIFKKKLIDENSISLDILSMRMAGDWFFWIKILQNTNIGFIPLNLNFFRNHKMVSRNHDSNIKKFQRVMEEKKIRIYLKDTLYIDQEKEWIRLYKLWFFSNSIFSLLKPSFYYPKKNSTTVIKYIYVFICYKLTMNVRKIYLLINKILKSGE